MPTEVRSGQSVKRAHSEQAVVAHDFSLAARVILYIHHPIDGIAHTTAFVIPGWNYDLIVSNCAMGRRIDPSFGGPIELFLVPTSVPRLV